MALFVLNMNLKLNKIPHVNVHPYIWWVLFGDAENISENGGTIITSYFETVVTTGFWAIIMEF